MKIKDFTQMSMERQYNSLRRTCGDLGYYFYENGDYDLNIIAIRNVDDLDSTKFNDFVAVAYLKNHIKQVNLFKATTDPGLTYRRKPINRMGTAILLPQQVRGGLRIGVHKGYEALVQNLNFHVIRDNDRDAYINDIAKHTMSEISVLYNMKFIGNSTNTIYTKSGDRVTNIEFGRFGINFHRASRWKILEHIGLYSAGCVVQQNPYKFHDEFMDIVTISKVHHGNTFTMTLLTNDKLR